MQKSSIFNLTLWLSIFFDEDVDFDGPRVQKKHKTIQKLKSFFYVSVFLNIGVNRMKKYEHV